MYALLAGYLLWRYYHLAQYGYSAVQILQYITKSKEPPKTEDDDVWVLVEDEHI